MPFDSHLNKMRTCLLVGSRKEKHSERKNAGRIKTVMDILLFEEEYTSGKDRNKY